MNTDTSFETNIVNLSETLLSLRISSIKDAATCTPPPKCKFEALIQTFISIPFISWNVGKKWTRLIPLNSLIYLF